MTHLLNFAKDLSFWGYNEAIGTHLNPIINTAEAILRHKDHRQMINTWHSKQKALLKGDKNLIKKHSDTWVEHIPEFVKALQEYPTYNMAQHTKNETQSSINDVTPVLHHLAAHMKHKEHRQLVSFHSLVHSFPDKVRKKISHSEEMQQHYGRLTHHLLGGNPIYYHHASNGLNLGFLNE